MENRLVSESLEEFQELTEKLKGKQYKIDADKNKKITPNDFTILRGEKKPPKKKVNEDFSDSEISAQEFDEYLDQLFNSGMDPKEVIEEAKKFIDEHPYMHEQMGELEGEDKYAIPTQKLIQYYEENRDEIERDYPDYSE
jgi:hypothetical protein